MVHGGSNPSTCTCYTASMQKIEEMFDSIADVSSELLGAPVVFIAAFLMCLLWLVSGPIFDWSDTWQLVINTATTVITFLMIFLVQSSQNKDTQTIHAKLDRLLKDIDGVDDSLAGIEKDPYEARQV